MPQRTRPARSGLLALRLASQRLSRHGLRTPAEVVAWMGAVQAQDFGASRWALGARLPGVAEAEVAREISEGRILRTHLFRGTWQLVTPADLRWMLELVAPRLLARVASRERELGLDDAAFRRSRTVLARALAAGRHLTRHELGAALERGGIPAAGPRLSHLLWRAELEGLICSGELRGSRPTHALLDDRAPPPRSRPARDRALCELALRHVRGRGPVTQADLATWAGITLADAREGLEAARPAILPERIGGQVHWLAADAAAAGTPAVHLLPAFDEYLIGYRDRSAMLEDGHARRVNAGGGLLAPCVLAGGRVVGIWSRKRSRETVEISTALFDAGTPDLERAVSAAGRRYAEFLGLAALGSPRSGTRSRASR